MLRIFPGSKVAIALLANALVDFDEADAQRIGALCI
jgi:hypothetical protein